MIDTILAPQKVIDKDLPQIGRALLNRLGAGELNMAEFLGECAYWCANYINGYRYRGHPSMPRDYAEYCRRKQADPDYKVAREFWDQPEIINYRYQVQQIKGQNDSSLATLRFMKANIPANDPIHEKIDMMLKSHGVTK